MKKIYNSFTLVEILIVVAIIAILAGLVIAVINPAQLRRVARGSNRKKDMAVIQAALEQYYADNNKYPKITVDDPASFACLESTLNGTDPDCNDSTPATGVKYLKTVPKTQGDSASEYCYLSEDTASPQNFVLCVPVEAEITDNSSTFTVEPTDCTVGGITGELGTDYGRFCSVNPF